MPQNLTINKISSIIGITLLFLVIAFTIFINFFVEEPINQQNNKEDSTFEYRVLEEEDLTSLWKLHKLQTKFINISQDKRTTHIHINKNLGITTYSPSNDDISDDNSINYGILVFTNSYTKDKLTKFEDFRIKYHNFQSIDFAKLNEIGDVFLKYQVASITTQLEAGDFTRINLKDGRSIFLVKRDAKLEKEYEKILGNAKSLNDSTKVIYHY